MDRAEGRVKILTDLLDKWGVRDQPWDTFVDYGSGNGEITNAIMKTLKPRRMIGMDVRPTAPPGALFEYIQSNPAGLPRIPLPDDSVDLLTAWVVLHHVRNINATIKEFRRVIPVNGFLFIREHDVPFDDPKRIQEYSSKKWGIPGLIDFLEDKHKEFPDHEGETHYLSRKRLGKILEKNGFCYIDKLDYPAPTNVQNLYHELWQRIE